MKNTVQSNGIVARQNEDYSISLLAAQSKLYDDVEKLNLIDFILSVILPLLLAVLKLYCDKSVVTNCSYVLSISMLFITVWISKYSRDKKVLASLIQLKFDLYVYQMPWDSKLFGKDKGVDAEVAENSKKLSKNNSEREKLVNWYTPIVDTMPIKEGILVCEKENCNWDVGLRKRYKNIAIIGLFLVMTVVLVLGFFRNETISNLMVQIIFIIPMLRWLINLMASLDDDVKRIQTISENISAKKEALSFDDLAENEKMITEHRRKSVKVPTFIYNRFKDNDEDREYRTALLESHNATIKH